MSENLFHRITFMDGSEKTLDGAVEFIDFRGMGDLSQIRKIELVPRPPKRLSGKRAQLLTPEWSPEVRVHEIALWFDGANGNRLTPMPEETPNGWHHVQVEAWVQLP